MPIKKSSLEEKLLYRVAKIFFLILPLLIAAVLFLRGYISIPKNILNISQKEIIDILQKNSTSIVYAVLGLVAYYLILKLVWRGVLYIAFGGLENDVNQPVPVRPASNTQWVPIVVILCILIAVFILFQGGYIKLPKTTTSSGGSTHTYGTTCTNSAGKKGLYGTNGNCMTCSSGTAVTNPISSGCSSGIAGVYCCSSGGGNNGGGGGTTCVPTGCGTMWRCSGTYYSGGQQLRVNGCLPVRAGEIYSSWSGTCRQCP